MKIKLCRRYFGRVLPPQLEPKKPHTYEIDKEKVKKMIEANMGEIVWRYVPGFKGKYVISCEGDVRVYSPEIDEWSLLNCNYQGLIVLFDENNQRIKKERNLLLKQTFPEIVTYKEKEIKKINKQKVDSEETPLEKARNSYPYKCYDMVAKETYYYVSLDEASKDSGMPIIMIEQNLTREINNIGGLVFYYNR